MKPSHRRKPPPRRLLLELGSGTHDEIRAAIVQLLARLGFDHDEQVDFLAGAFVTAALHPHWAQDRTPIEAHERLRAHDPELADVVESIAPALLARIETRQEQAAALRAIERLLR